jgi:hypothetical protein
VLAGARFGPPHLVRQPHPQAVATGYSTDRPPVVVTSCYPPLLLVLRIFADFEHFLSTFRSPRKTDRFDCDRPGIFFLIVKSTPAFV